MKICSCLPVLELLNGTVKLTFTLEEAMKAQRGSRVIVLLFL
jgi:hypothetical protein